MRTHSTTMRWWCGLALVLCAATVPVVNEARQYRTADVESLRVVIDADWVTRAAPGYLPLRIDITNLGDARVIDIVLQGSRLFRTSPMGQAQSTVRQVVRLEAGARVRLTMPVPVFADNENFVIEILEGTRRLERFSFAGVQSGVALAGASVLLVADAASPFGAIAATLARPMTRGGSPFVVARGGTIPAPTPPLRMPTLDALLEPARLPANWLAYTSVRAVAIGRDEWQQLNDGQKNALLTWTALGGDLIFVDGALNVLLPDVAGDPAADSDRIVARHFFGRIHVLTSTSLATVGLAGVLTDTETHRDPLWALPANTAPDWGAIEGRGFRLSIPGVDGVPVRAFLVMLLVFSVVIGPASYWFLRRKGQLVLLVLTTPLISLVSIILLAGFALADEGSHVQGRAVTFTLLDQVRKQSATRATVSYYAPGLAPSGGLRFSRDVAVFPIGADGRGSRGRMTLDLTDTQAFTQGLLETRAPTNFEQAVFRPARERLTFSRTAAGLTVTNGLDTSLVALRYRDGDTLYVLTGPLPSGGQQTMTRIAAADGPSAQLPLPVKFLPLLEHQPAGSYLALLDRSPFWEPGASGVLERGSVHLVLGWPEAQR